MSEENTSNNTKFEDVEDIQTNQSITNEQVSSINDTENATSNSVANHIALNESDDSIKTNSYLLVVESSKTVSTVNNFNSELKFLDNESKTIKISSSDTEINMLKRPLLDINFSDSDDTDSSEDKKTKKKKKKKIEKLESENVLLRSQKGSQNSRNLDERINNKKIHAVDRDVRRAEPEQPIVIDFFANLRNIPNPSEISLDISENVKITNKVKSTEIKEEGREEGTITEPLSGNITPNATILEQIDEQDEPTGSVKLVKNDTEETEGERVSTSDDLLKPPKIEYDADLAKLEEVNKRIEEFLKKGSSGKRKSDDDAKN